jgi:uncharacterized protein (TIGR03437 family)
LTKLVLYALCAVTVPHACAILNVSGGDVFLPERQTISVGTTDGKKVKFRYAGIEPGIGNPPNFIVLSPATGVTPQLVGIALNPLVAGNLQPGRGVSLFVIFTTVDESPVERVPVLVRYTPPGKPAPAIQSVTNTASLRPYFSPGALITIVGSNLASPSQTGSYDDTALYPRTLGNSTVTIGGVAAPLLYVSSNQINAVLPYDPQSRASPEVVVTHFGQASVPHKILIDSTSPAIFTLNQTGTGQGVIRQMATDRTFSFNSADNPAGAGSPFEMYCTGVGEWNLPLFGDVSLGNIVPLQLQAVTVTVGGVPARVLYAGPPGGLLAPWGYVQVNAIVPDGVGSGPQPLVIKIGPNDSSQQSVTIALK